MSKDININNVDDINAVSLVYNYDNPIFVDIEGSECCLCIDTKYYDKRNIFIKNQNKTIIDNLINKVIRTSKLHTFKIKSSKLITDELIDALISNDNIKIIDFSGSRYRLNIRYYNLFKRANKEKIIGAIIDIDLREKLKDRFDFMTGYNSNNNLFGHYSYSQLQYCDNIYLSNNLSKEELENLKYIPFNKILKITIDSFDYLKTILSYLNKFNLNNALYINIDCDVADELIELIINNSNIKEVKFTNRDYVLSKKYYDYLINSSVEKIIVDDCDDIIKFNIDPKVELSTIKIKLKKVGMEELEMLKYISSEKEIYLYEDAIYRLDDIVRTLENYNLNNSIEIVLKDKDKYNYNYYLLNTNFNYKNIYVKAEGDVLYLNDYINFEKYLYKLIEPAQNLSPFERYIYAYNIVKKYGKYSESNEDSKYSRNLYHVINGDKIVCVGFSRLLGDLLDKLNILNAEFNLNVDKSYDHVNTSTEDTIDTTDIINYVGHARRLVYIHDDKYKIKGYYLSDPTWDNFFYGDYYNHLLITNNEALDGIRYIEYNNIDDLLNINSLDEFYSKLDIAINKYNYGDFLLREYIKEYEEKNKKPYIWVKDNSISNIEKRKNIILDLINLIESIDHDFRKKLKSKFDYIYDDIWPNDITDLLDLLGKYILHYFNNKISGETIFSAVSSVKSKLGTLDEKELEDIVRYNNVRQNKIYPKRYKIYKDGKRVLLSNTYNKFNIDLESVKKR